MPGFFSDLKGDPRNSNDVLQWILENVPCFPGTVPKTWEEAVYLQAKRRGVNPTVLSLAISLARSLGYQFTDPYKIYHISDIAPIYRNSGPSMRATTAAEERAGRIAYIEDLEWKYRIASATDNVEQMKRIAMAIVDSLNDADPEDAEIVWGARLVPRGVEKNTLRIGAPRGGRGGDASGGGPYRVAPWLEAGLGEGNEGEAD